MANVSLFVRQHKVDCCYNCPERTLGCHSTCSVYNKEKAAHERYMKALREAKGYDRDTNVSEIFKIKPVTVG